MFNKKVNLWIPLAFVLGIVFISSISHFNNSTDEWAIFERYRTLTQGRLAVFYARAGVHYNFINDDDLLYFENFAISTWGDSFPSVTPLLQNAIALRSYELEDFYGATFDDYMLGVDTEFLRLLSYTPTSHIIHTFSLNETILDFSSHETNFLLHRDLTLQRIQNIFYALVETTINENNLIVMMDLVAWVSSLFKEYVNWDFGCIPPEEFKYSWEEINSLLLETIYSISIWIDGTTWLHENVLYSIRTKVLTNLDFIINSYGIYPDLASTQFPEGVITVDQFGILRVGDSDPFYVLEDGEYRLCTIEDWEIFTEFYTYTNGEYIKVE